MEGFQKFSLNLTPLTGSDIDAVLFWREKCEAANDGHDTEQAERKAA